MRAGRPLHRQRPEDLDHAGAVRRLDLLPGAAPIPTAKKQDGISFLLIDMKTPGITVRPISTMDGGHEVNEVFFDDVKVPVENLVGEENKGWDCAKFLLGNERTGIARVGDSKRACSASRSWPRRCKAGDRPLIEDERFREKIAAVEVELKALEMTQLRVARRRSATARTGARTRRRRSSRSRAREIQQRDDRAAAGGRRPAMRCRISPTPTIRVRLERAAGRPRTGRPPAAPAYFNYRKTSIYGGSNEIQRNIIAKAVLGLLRRVRW